MDPSPVVATILLGSRNANVDEICILWANKFKVYVVAACDWLQLRRLFPIKIPSTISRVPQFWPSWDSNSTKLELIVSWHMSLFLVLTWGGMGGYGNMFKSAFGLKIHNTFKLRNRITENKFNPLDFYLPRRDNFCSTLYFSKFGTKSLKWLIMGTFTLRL